MIFSAKEQYILCSAIVAAQISSPFHSGMKKTKANVSRRDETNVVVTPSLASCWLVVVVSSLFATLSSKQPPATTKEEEGKLSPLPSVVVVFPADRRLRLSTQPQTT